MHWKCVEGHTKCKDLHLFFICSRKRMWLIMIDMYYASTTYPSYSTWQGRISHRTLPRVLCRWAAAAVTPLSIASMLLLQGAHQLIQSYNIAGFVIVMGGKNLCISISFKSQRYDWNLNRHWTTLFGRTWAWIICYILPESPFSRRNWVFSTSLLTHRMSSAMFGWGFTWPSLSFLKICSSRFACFPASCSSVPFD